MRGSVLGVLVSRTTGTLLPDLFLAIRFVLVPCYSFPASCKPKKKNRRIKKIYYDKLKKIGKEK
jgi:hypothetical protein